MPNIVSYFNNWVRDEEWKNNSCCSAPDMETVTHCRDCIHRPHKKWFGDDYDIVPPLGINDYTCPFIRAAHPWDNSIPGDSFYCAYGERKK